MTRLRTYTYQAPSAKTYEMVQVPQEGPEQGEFIDHLCGLGLKVNAYDGLVRKTEKPMRNGANWRWSALTLTCRETGARLTAQPGQWVIPTPRLVVLPSFAAVELFGAPAGDYPEPGHGQA